MNEAAYELRTSGLTWLRGLLEPPRVTALRRDLDALLDADEAEWGREQLVRMGQHGALRNLCDAAPSFAALLDDAVISAIVRELLGEHALHSYDGLVLFPGTGRFPWDFHTDVAPLAGVAFPADAAPGVNCLFYLDDVTTDNGATWLVPASHRGHGVPSPELLGRLASQATGAAGDVLLFDARLWHCAGENRAASPRRIVKMLFTRPWLKPQMDYTRAVREEVRAGLSEQTLKRLGVGFEPPSTVVELRRRLAPTTET